MCVPPPPVAQHQTAGPNGTPEQTNQNPPRGRGEFRTASSRDGGHLCLSPLTTRRRRGLGLGERRSLDRLRQNGSKHHRSEERGGPDGEGEGENIYPAAAPDPEANRSPAAKPEQNFHLRKPALSLNLRHMTGIQHQGRFGGTRADGSAHNGRLGR